jgi:hypothetical protein
VCVCDTEAVAAAVSTLRDARVKALDVRVGCLRAVRRLLGAGENAPLEAAVQVCRLPFAPNAHEGFAALRNRAYLCPVCPPLLFLLAWRGLSKGGCSSFAGEGTAAGEQQPFGSRSSDGGATLRSACPLMPFVSVLVEKRAEGCGTKGLWQVRK